MFESRYYNHCALRWQKLRLRESVAVRKERHFVLPLRIKKKVSLIILSKNGGLVFITYPQNPGSIKVEGAEIMKELADGDEDCVFLSYEYDLTVFRKNLQHLWLSPHALQKIKIQHR